MLSSAASLLLLASVALAKESITYSTVPGYFLQDDPKTNNTGFDYTAVNFGLINQTYPGVDAGSLTQWQQFERLVDSLNAGAPLDTVYKVFWFGRHGEGYHNAAESFYGTPAWNCYWSELDGNGTVTWADADLTINGIKQAQIANAFWKSRIALQKIPYPQSYYTSPLTRCLRTANITFSDINLPYYYSFTPTVKELFREGISTHTCDRRSSKSYIQNRFPDYEIERGFTDNDELWNAHYAETGPAQDARSKTVLDEVFKNDDHTWISVTSHSGEIGSLLRVLGHQPFSLSTGAIIPVLVKAEIKDGVTASTSSFVARTSSRYCTNGPPITSISTGTQGCVCTGDTGASSTRLASASATRSASGSIKASSGTSKITSAAMSGSTASQAASSVRSVSSGSKAAVTTSSSSKKTKSACKSKDKTTTAYY